MRMRRTRTERTKVAIARWAPFGGREFALIVLVAFGAVALGLFMKW